MLYVKQVSFIYIKIRAGKQTKCYFPIEFIMRTKTHRLPFILLPSPLLFFLFVRSFICVHPQAKNNNNNNKIIVEKTFCFVSQKRMIRQCKNNKHERYDAIYE